MDVGDHDATKSCYVQLLAHDASRMLSARIDAKATLEGFKAVAGER